MESERKSGVVEMYEGWEIEREAMAMGAAMQARRSPAPAAPVWDDAAAEWAAESRRWSDKASSLQAEIDAIYTRAS
jgi:hypothetical protein